jgi:hypothetical protein
LNGALDLNLYLKREDGTVTGKLTKNRNGSTDSRLAFTVETIRMGEDGDGDSITTAICREADAGSVSKAKPLTPKQQAAFSLLIEVLDGAEEVALSEWRKACVESPAVSAADKLDDRGKAFRRIFEQLAQRGEVFTRNGFVSTGRKLEHLLSDEDVEDRT